MKLKRFLPLGLLLVAGIVWSRSSDIWSLRGRTYLKTTDVIRLTDSATPDLEIYNGDIYLKAADAAPSTTAGGYPGIKVPFTNTTGASLSQGMIVCASTGTGNARAVAVTATTTVVGVVEGTVATGSVGYMIVAGYALVLTTGTVLPGDVIVSSNIAASNSVLGYGGADATPDSGADVGVAMSAGTAAGGLTLIKIR